MIVSEGACGRNFIGRRHAAMIQTRGRGTTEIACDCQEKDKNNSDRPHRELTRTRERYKNDAGDANVCVNYRKSICLPTWPWRECLMQITLFRTELSSRIPGRMTYSRKYLRLVLAPGVKVFTLVVRHLTARVIPRGLRSMTVHFGRIEHTSLCFASPSVTS